jgi:hypothetical protein
MKEPEFETRVRACKTCPDSCVKLGMYNCKVSGKESRNMGTCPCKKW